MALLDYALCSVSDVRDTPGVPSSISDAYITRKVNQATLIIENYCGRRFKETDYVDEPHDGSLTDQLVLLQRPVNTSETFTLKSRDSTLNQADTTTIDTDNYFINSEAGTVGAVSSFYGSFDRWLVTYTAGYATIPADIAEACCTLAAYLCINALTPGQSAKRKQEGSREIEYFAAGGGNTTNPSSDILKQLGIDSMLAPYANTVISGNR